MRLSINDCNISDYFPNVFGLHYLSLPVSGFVIVGEDNTGKLDLGIFIASVVPDGPADKDGRIKTGREQRQNLAAHINQIFYRFVDFSRWPTHLPKQNQFGRSDIQ